MKLCIYVGYHDANNVYNFDGDPVTQLYGQYKLVLLYAVLLARRTIAVTRPLVLRLLLRDHAQAAGVWKTDAGHTSLSTSLVNVNQHPHFYHANNVLLFSNVCEFDELRRMTKAFFLTYFRISEYWAFGLQNLFVRTA